MIKTRAEWEAERAQYLSDEPFKRLLHLGEECNEVSKEILKYLRFDRPMGEIVPGKNITQYELLRRELFDLKMTLERVEEQMGDLAVRE